MLHRRRTVLLVALPLLVAACGGGSSFKSGPAATTTTAKKADAAADLALAKRSVLTAADMPGYDTSPHDSSGDMTPTEKQAFSKCMSVPTSFFDDKPGEQKADSPDFSKSSGDTSVTNNVAIETTKALVDSDWEQLVRPETPQCFQQLLESAVTSGGTGIKISDASVTAFDPKIGSRSVGFSIKFTVTGPGGSLTGYADAIMVGRGRAEIELDAENGNTPFDRATEIALAQKVYDRVGNGAD